jgi:hypothetical protein
LYWSEALALIGKQLSPGNNGRRSSTSVQTHACIFNLIRTRIPTLWRREKYKTGSDGDGNIDHQRKHTHADMRLRNHKNNNNHTNYNNRHNDRRETHSSPSTQPADQTSIALP